jgi:hypothetical protein
LDNIEANKYSHIASMPFCSTDSFGGLIDISHFRALPPSEEGKVDTYLDSKI